MFTAGLFTIVKTWIQPKCPWMDKWLQKKYMYSGILLSHKKEATLPLTTTWMDLEDNLLSEISQTEKDKYHMISFICGFLKKKKKVKLTETENRKVPGAGR